MSGNYSNNDGIICCVCILKDKNTEAFRVVYTLNIQRYMQQPDNSTLKLVYFRGFSDLLDGIGHKLFLEQLSAMSIKRFVMINKQDELDELNAES